MNRELQRKNSRRKVSRGGGYGMGAPLVPIPSGPGSDWTFAVKEPVNQGYDDCTFPARPGQLFNMPNPALAQVAMAGGVRSANTALQAAGVRRRRTQHRRSHHKQRGGAVDSIEASHAYRPNGWDQTLSHGTSSATAWGRDTGLIQTVMAGGSRKKYKGGAIDPIEASHAYPSNGWETPSTHGGQAPTWGPQTGLAQVGMAGGSRKRRGSRKMRGGADCGCSGSKLFGGSRRRNTRRMRGGASNGYAIDPSVSIGGNGPNVDALRTPVPCDPLPGSQNSINPTGPLDPRSYYFGYSLTENKILPTLQAGGSSILPSQNGTLNLSNATHQAGGAYSTGNAYPDSCYKAPGSELPVYEAQTAGFNFYPSIARGGTLSDGITPYNDVVPYAARMGGSRRKNRKGRKGHKGRKSSHRK